LLTEPSTRIGLALAHLAEDTPESFKAKSEAERALAIARKISERVVKLEALNMLGEISCQTGDARGAIRHHRDALRLALNVDNGYGTLDSQKPSSTRESWNMQLRTPPRRSASSGPTTTG
jgi:hypothetical protein